MKSNVAAKVGFVILSFSRLLVFIELLLAGVLLYILK